MNRKRTEVSTVRISDEEYSRLENKLEGLRNEFLICKRKLDSKCEALLILSKELDQCRSERDQFKLMAEQLRERYQTLKKQMSGQPVASSTDNPSVQYYSDMQSQSLAKLLCEARDQNKSLQFEIDDLKQKLQDAWGDIKLLREQIARQRVGTSDEGMNTRHFPAHEREDLVQQLEASRDQYVQLERDLQQVLDEKEELVTERDVYKTKYERLNQELNYILKGDENRVVDIDALVMENKYLQERMKQTEEEKSMAMAAVNKYKSLLERKKTKGCMKLGQSRGGGMVISQKQVKQVLDSHSTQVASPQAMADVQALAGALLDTVNDKNLALSHQRKTNKILGCRVAELEKKIKTLEVAGLWNVPSSVSASLEKLRAECDEVKTLIPLSHSSDSIVHDKVDSADLDGDSELGSVSPLDSALTSPQETPTHAPSPRGSRYPGRGALGHLEMEDLDMLPTKEVSSRPAVQPSAVIAASPRPATVVSACQQFAGEQLPDEVFLRGDIHEDIPQPAAKTNITDASQANSDIFETDIRQDHVLVMGGDEPKSESLVASNFAESTGDSSTVHDEECLDTVHVHVYSDDKADDEDEDRLSPENTHTYGRHDDESEGASDADEETAERISLLVSDMTQKIQTISHNAPALEDRDKVVQGQDSSASLSGPAEPASCKSPLLSEGSESQSELEAPAHVHVDDVQC